MRFFSILAAAGAVGAATIQQRTDVDDFINAITVPTTGTVIQPGEVFPFQYGASSRCHLLYTGVRIWLLSEQPTLAEFDSDGVLTDSSLSLNYYGEYIAINIPGVPNYTGSPTIPNNFTMPTLDPSLIGSNVYLTTTQSENGGCPPYYPTGFDASYVEIQYGSA